MTSPHCLDCGKYTLTGPDQDLYMVKNEIWKKYGAGKFWLCRPCLEKRMGRKLNRNDYKNCVLNQRQGLLNNDAA